MLSDEAKSLGDQSAFPVPLVSHCDRLESSWDTGLTKRQWLIGTAMQGICAYAHPEYKTGECNSAIANRAIAVADAILEALAAEGSK